MSICNDWIERTMGCFHAKRKIGKYKFRTNKVLKDVLWHILELKKCSNRKRRELELPMVPIIEYNYDEYDGYEFYEYEPLEATEGHFSSENLNSETLIRNDFEPSRDESKEFVKKFGSWFREDSLAPSRDDEFGSSLGNVVWLNEAGNGFLGLSELGESWKKFDEEISFDFDQFELRIERLNIKRRETIGSHNNEMFFKKCTVIILNLDFQWSCRMKIFLQMISQFTKMHLVLLKEQNCNAIHNWKGYG